MDKSEAEPSKPQHPGHDNLSSWCLAHNLGTIEKKLRNDCGLSDPSEFELLSSDELEQVIQDCAMNAGERARFRKATASEPASPKSQREFSPLGIHQALKQGLGSSWDPKVHGVIVDAVQSHLSSPKIKAFLQDRTLTEDEGGALIYFSVDATQFLGTEIQNISSILNPILLFSHQPPSWQQFLFFLYSGKNKLQTISGKMYLAINTPTLNCQHRPDARVLPGISRIHRDLTPGVQQGIIPTFIFQKPSFLIFDFCV